jgi:hypothetical protein
MRGPALSLGLTIGLASLAQAQVPVSQVELTLTPAAPVKGQDTTAVLDIALTGTEHSAPPVLRANVGTLDPVARIGPRTFRARYTLPVTRFPEVAIIVAFAPSLHPQSVEGAVGVLRVPMASAVEVPGKAEAGASIVLELAGRRFGPAIAAADGTFRLPVVVPPGVGVAHTTTHDVAGNTRLASLNLALPPTDQLACVMTPTRLPADGRAQARVLCASSDASGNPSRGARLQWQGARGTMAFKHAWGDGLQEFTYVSPRELGAAEDEFQAVWKQARFTSTETLKVALSHGAVRALELKSASEIAHAGSVLKIRAHATDAFGRSLPGVTLKSPLAPTAMTDAAGNADLRWSVSRDAPLGPRQFIVRASGPAGVDAARFDGWTTADGGLGVLVSDNAGLPVGGQLLVAGEARSTTDDEGIAWFPSLQQVHHADWPMLRLLPADVVGTQRPGVTASLQVVVGPALLVNVQARLDGSHEVVWWVESESGEMLDGRTVEVRSAQSANARTSRGESREPAVPGLMSITDVASGVTAVVEVPQ